MLVYVLNKKGEPLMPCSPRKARKLLKTGEAKVVKLEPFTIKLVYGSSGYKQLITLGVDAGSKFVGFSATTASAELFAAEYKLRNDLVELLSTRRQNRRTRRSRLRYRKPRFLNRKKPTGWLAPSVQHKVDAHLRFVELIHKLLPVSKLVVECASFDLQKLQNPDLRGTDYQQGPQLGFWNVREYVLFRDGHTCQHCKGKTKDKVLNVHHLESRKTGGDSPGNLLTLCETCHSAYHLGKLKLNAKRSESFRDATFMGVMRWSFFNKLKTLYPDVKLTFGYLTKHTRITHGLEKSHRVDARCISGTPLALPAEHWYFVEKKRCQNRQIHKAKCLKGGRRKLNQAPYLVEGFRLFDKVVFEGQVCFVFARRLSGYFNLRTLSGTVVSQSASYKKLKLVQARKSLLWERR